MNDTMNVSLIQSKTTNYLLGALNNTRAHAGELLAKTKDFEGYEELLKYLDGMKEAILDYDEENNQ